ncbi:MAG: hypothetical protein SGI86_11290 [Deltaproteobacteria bacterium]|nr:hypothetical protein [Deltaproteobacteria bacterium]
MQARLFHCLTASAAFGALVVSGQLAFATEAARVVSGGEEANPYDLNLTVGYSSAFNESQLKREGVGSNGQTEEGRDLIYKSSRNYLNLRADIGLLPDVGFFVTLPFVISDNRSLYFDQSSDACPSKDCIDSSNSSTLRDGVLPGYGQSNFGYNGSTGGQFSSPSRSLFKGPKRSGIEYLGAGLQWAIFNQQRVDSEATWIVSFESRLSVAKDQRFDPSNPSANTAAGLGYHQLVFGSMGSRRFGNVEPYLGGYYMLPVKTKDSIFRSQGLGENTFSNPQHRGGIQAGLDGIVYEDRKAGYRVGMEIRGGLEVRFLGLAQSQLWEPLGASSLCTTGTETACRPIDQGDTNGDGMADPHTGVVRSPTYGVFSGDVGLNATMGQYARFRGMFGMVTEQDRFLTDGRSGVAVIDAPGRRYSVQHARGYRFFVEAGLVF